MQCIGICQYMPYMHKICFQRQIFGPVMEAMDGQVYEKRKKGGWRVWEILKRGAIGRWVGEVRGGQRKY